jgi:hypothetical protein
MKSRTIPISNQEWLDLAASLQLDALKSLDTVIGCPDCADGGGEWIEVQTATMRRKVTFEYGKNVPAIGPLLEKVRAIRKRGED